MPSSELSVLGPVLQGGFAVFALLLFGLVVWIVRRLFGERENDFKHIRGDLSAIRQRLDELPCDVHAEKHRQLEKRLNDLSKQES